METETGVKKCTIQVIPGYEGFDKGGVENTKETDQSNVQTGDNNFEVVAGDNMKGSGKGDKGQSCWFGSDRSGGYRQSIRR